MKNKLAVLAVSFAVLFLSACGGNEVPGGIETAPPPTPLPTDTPPPSPTNTPLPTHTPTPIFTPVSPTPAPPPGGHIYFTRRLANSELVFCRVTPDGKNLEELYHLQEGDNCPVPSPDGQYIAFDTLTYNPNSLLMESVINVMNLDNREITRLTGEVPHWSADGKQIIFTNGGDIYAVNIDGSGLTGLLIDEFYDISGNWSPAGERIAFSSDRDSERHNIYILESDGQIRRLTDNPEGDWAPEWSPDGTQIAFHSGWHDDSDIYIINADGTRQTQITDGPRIDLSPTWSPDGEYIVFSSYREGGKSGIYIIRKDGTGLTEIVGGITYSAMMPYWIAGPTL